MNLQPMNGDVGTPEEVTSPVVRCENCGTARPSHRMVNFVVCVGSPGHEDLPPFQCNAKQVDPRTPMHALGHWGCSEECIETIMRACIEQHMIPALRSLRATIDKEFLR